MRAGSGVRTSQAVATTQISDRVWWDPANDVGRKITIRQPLGHSPRRAAKNQRTAIRQKIVVSEDDA